MSDKAARVHTHASNRAKISTASDRKTVYKPVLDSPFGIAWPRVPTNVQNALLARIVALLGDVRAYHIAREHRSRTRKCTERRAQCLVKKNGGVLDGTNSITHNNNVAESSSAHTLPEVDANIEPIAASSADVGAGGVPPVLEHITFGINEVTKRLEGIARCARKNTTLSLSDITVPAGAAAQMPLSRPVGLVLTCTGDIDPPALVEHIPALIAACNSSVDRALSNQIKLIPLPQGSEQTLAEAMGLRRVAILAIETDAPGFSDLSDLAAGIPTLFAPWLVPQNASLTLESTRVKQLRTSAPKDMKAAKEDRAKRKAAAKAKRSAKLDQPMTVAAVPESASNESSQPAKRNKHDRPRKRVKIG